MAAYNRIDHVPDNQGDPDPDQGQGTIQETSGDGGEAPFDAHPDYNNWVAAVKSSKSMLVSCLILDLFKKVWNVFCCKMLRMPNKIF